MQHVSGSGCSNCRYIKILNASGMCQSCEMDGVAWQIRWNAQVKSGWFDNEMNARRCAFWLWLLYSARNDGDPKIVIMERDRLNRVTLLTNPEEPGWKRFVPSKYLIPGKPFWFFHAR